MKLVIFDLDDTLIDFARTREIAYRLLGEQLARRGVDSTSFLHACAQADRPLFQRFERGEISRDEYRWRRFADPLLAVAGAAPDELVRQLNTSFMDCVNDAPQLYDDAVACLQRVRAAGLHSAILTNGPSDGQRRKLRATGLGELVDRVAIGEELGFSKPDARAYHGVVEAFGLQADEGLMVGDSPELDFDGARRAGLHALLLDRADRYARHDGARILSLSDLPVQG